jgi:hypothetical protein
MIVFVHYRPKRFKKSRAMGIFFHYQFRQSPLPKSRAIQMYFVHRPWLQTPLHLLQDDCRHYRISEGVALTNRSIHVIFDFQSRHSPSRGVRI